MKGFYFDKKAADLAELFFSEFLIHVKGVWFGQPFVLLSWERKIIRQIFGWKRLDGTRKYRFVYIEIPKKNGKSTFAAGIALLLTFADDEPGAEVYSAAGDRSQAAIVFDLARNMTELSPHLSERSKVYRKSIFVESSFSRYEAISREAGTKHGTNPHGIIFDELHVQKTRELWDTLTSGEGARRQPLIVVITTAGWDKTSICWEQHDYAQKVKDGIIKDDECLPVIFAAKQGDDWTDPKVWKKANPSLGITFSEEYLKKKCDKAQKTPGYINTFKRLNLNIWTEQAKVWIDINDWKACKNGVSIESMQGYPCFAALDLSSTRDLTSLGLLFPPESEDEYWVLLTRFYMPEDNIMKRVEESGIPYDVWTREGYIKVTPGNVVDYAFIRNDIKKLGLIVGIKEIAIDRWNATYLMTQLLDDGLKVVPFGQGWGSMSGPSKEFEKIVVSHDLRHDDNPTMAWMMANAAIKEDPAGNIKPDKSRSSGKIDGVVTAIMAVGRAIFEEQEKPSVYERKGQLLL